MYSGNVIANMDMAGWTENVKAVVADERLGSTWIGTLVHCERLREGEAADVMVERNHQFGPYSPL